VCEEFSGPVFFGLGRDDGLGATLSNIILHLATAWKYSVRFGGFLHHGHREGKHEEEFYQTLSMMLGFDYDVLRAQGEPRIFETCLHGCESPDNIQQVLRMENMKNKPVLLDNWALPLPTLTLPFIQQWRSISGVASRPAKYFKPSGYHIAVHVRRGDVTPTVLALLPDAEVHIFSTTIDHVSKKQMLPVQILTCIDNLGISCILMVLRSTIWFICQRLMFLFATKVPFQWLQLSSIRSVSYLLPTSVKPVSTKKSLQCT